MRKLIKTLKAVSIILVSVTLLTGCGSTSSIKKVFKDVPEELKSDIMSAIKSEQIKLNIINTIEDNTYIIIDQYGYNKLSSNNLYILVKAMDGINDSEPNCDTLVSKDIYLYNSTTNEILLKHTLDRNEVIGDMYRALDHEAETHTPDEMILKMDQYRKELDIEFTNEQQKQYDYYHNDSNEYYSYYESVKAELKKQQEEVKKQQAEERRKREIEQAKCKEEDRLRKLKNSEPYIGMSESDINNTAWGYYRDKNETITIYGSRVQYCFSYYGYVYTENGVVTAIQK